jgi:hypothetical protein
LFAVRRIRPGRNPAAYPAPTRSSVNSIAKSLLP